MRLLGPSLLRVFHGLLGRVGTEFGNVPCWGFCGLVPPVWRLGPLSTLNSGLMSLDPGMGLAVNAGLVLPLSVSVCVSVSVSDSFSVSV